MFLFAPQGATPWGTLLRRFACFALTSLSLAALRPTFVAKSKQRASPV